MGIAKNYKLYVFDFDGTLADTKYDLRTAFSEALKWGGFGEPGEEDVIAAVGKGAANALKKLTGLGDADIAPYVAVFKQAYERVCCDNARLYPGSKELLNRLKRRGAVIALVTMKMHAAAHKIIKYLGIDVFDDVIAYDDIEKRKPDPESFIKLLKKYKIAPDAALMVGDSITDMLYAKAAGADCCIMAHGYGNEDEIRAGMPKYLLKSFADF